MIFHCSNCNHKTEYSDEEVENAFPDSREILICKNCKHPFSVTDGARDLFERGLF